MDRYEESLERAKNELPINEVSPELKETKDERIKREIIEYIEAFANAKNEKIPTEWLDWFEKQKEQRPIEWSKDFEDNIRILLHDKLTWRSEDGSISSIVVIDDKTLKDIVTGIWFYVGKEANKYLNKELKVEQKPIKRPKFKIGDVVKFKGFGDEPANDTPLKIVGYDNELYLFDNGTTDLFSEQNLYELVEQKPIEKQSMLKKLREHLANTPEEQLDVEFEALKDLTIDKPAEWSKEDKEMLLSAMEYIQTYPAHRQSVVDWLKNLPNRFCLQYKQEWSKEEKGILLECVTALQNSSHWLLADKLSSLSPQPQWKPSEEQIEALEWMLTTVSFKDGGYGVVLKNLINDLKKQM